MLNNILRVIQIARLFIKYDVDKMLVNCGSGRCKFYFYMLPWNWFRKRRIENIPLKIRMMFEELRPNICEIRTSNINKKRFII
jgi:hypothetical protein